MKKNFMKKNLILNLLVVLFLSQQIVGQIKSDSLAVDLQALNVNAQRTKLFTGLGRAITVLERKTIQQMPVQHLDELLKSISGIDIRQRGVGGTQSDISLRGGSFDQVLVLLNGVNITDPQTGHYNLDVPVELSDIVRVELLEGSAARMYGPNAFSGAINIVTEKNPEKSLSANITAGSYDTYTQNISGNIGNQKIQTFASFSNKSSAGYINNTDYHLLNVFSQSVLRTSRAGKFDLQMAYQLKDYGANGFYTLKYPAQFDHTQTYFGAIDWAYSRNNTSLSAQTYFRRHYDRFELFRDSIQHKPSWYTGHNYHLTDVSGAKATAIYQSDFAKYTVGIDVRNEHIYSTVLGTKLAQTEPNPFEESHPFTKGSNRLLSTAYLDFSKSINSIYFSLGASATYTEQYGFSAFGGVDIAYLFNENLRIYLSANSAVRLPTFTDLYYQSATQIANPNLLPERSKTVELGLKYNNEYFKLNGSAFYRMGENIIDWVKQPDSTKWESRNLTNVNALGLNVMTEYSFKHGFLKKVSVSYAYLQLDKQADNFDSKYALDYLKHKFVVGVHHNIISRLSAMWQLSYNDRAGDYTDFLSGKKTNYDPFVMANMRLNWVAKHYELYADVNNLLNINYADFGGLTQPGINFLVGIRVKY